MQKAEIFKRDRATCCFSGANLWLLDAPLRVGWQSDWADHSRPLSRGGKSKHENGVCASHTFNLKKRNNSADRAYLFHEGRPTPLYLEIFGVPLASVTDRLQRLAKLDEVDWHFNRAVTWIFEAFDYKWAQPDYVRTDEYWFKAAHKNLTAFRKIRGNVPTLEARGIVTDPSETQTILLSIRECDSLESLKKRVRPLSSKYIRNSQAWWDYFNPEKYMESPSKNDAQRRRSYQKACRRQDKLTDDTFACIESDFKARHGLF